MTSIKLLTATLLALLAVRDTQAHESCPFHFGQRAEASLPAVVSRRSLLGFDQSAVASLDIDAVKADLKALFLDSQEFWPADYGHYGPLLIRQAWHCSGSYRTSDGRGGCDGARPRFDPERSWIDNTNLDKARDLLWPVKDKYGAALSWGDLIVLAGDTAIESMGGPILGFCAGRIDDDDGTASLELGPSPDQEAVAPCPVQGDCPAPLGQATMSLIYVDPEGPHGNPVPELSVPQIRDTFGRMAMNDSETVALIGGGHAFGKTHGACPTGAGPSPKEQPWDSWPGTCGSGPMKGKGDNTFTSGFEGPWTQHPTAWDNSYFQNLLKYDWEVVVGPGGHHQWRPRHRDPASASSTEPLPNIMMLTTDVALTRDPAYLELVKLFATDLAALNHAFSHAWYKLTTRDMGPVSRCLGNHVPPPQPFQAPLPPPPAPLPDFDRVAQQLHRALTHPSSVLQPDTVGGKPYYGALFATLAWQCASSFRETDYSGGCNGARIRFAPQKDWPANKGMDSVLLLLQQEVGSHFASLSAADLMVLAGTVAVEAAAGGAIRMQFCGGRSDAEEGEPRVEIQALRTLDDKLVQLRDNMKVMGLEAREMVALQARPRSPNHQQLLGYSGSWSPEPSCLTNDYFKVLLKERWENVTSPAGLMEMKAVGKELYLTPTDLAVKWDAQFRSIAQEFAYDSRAFLEAFASGWTRVMNADRFKGPAGSECP